MKLLRSNISRIYSRANKHITRLRLLTAAVVVGLTPLATALVRAVSDTTPMHFTSLAADMTTVDVSAGPVQVIFMGPTEDDISGYGTVQAYYTSPSGNQIFEVDEGVFEGTIYNGNVVFQKNAEAGLWRPTFTLADLSGNTDVLDADELDALGFDIDINVVSATPDLIAPALVSSTVTNTTLDTSLSTATTTVNVTISDALSVGSNGMYARFISPSGTQVITDYFSTVNEAGGIYLSDPLFPRYSEVGTWSIELTIKDRPGNTAVYDATDLQNLGLQSTITMTGVGDTTPVSVDLLEFDAANPATGGVSASGAIVTLHGEFSDNLSGIDKVYVRYVSQTSSQLAIGEGRTSEFGGNPWQIDAYFPPYSSVGLWLPEITTIDYAGNVEVLDDATLQGMGYNLAVTLLENVSDELPVNGTVTTDPENDGATVADPLESSVTTPIAGEVSIVRLEIGEITDLTNGYRFLGQQISISAPEATVEAPLLLQFNIDSSAVQPGETAANIEVFRNAVLIEDCLSPTIADPDPCVATRTTLGDGDIQVTVRTSSASAWTLAFSDNTSTYQFEGFSNPIKDAPQLNEVKKGQSIPVKFDLGGDFGLSVLVDGSPKSQRINCNTKEPIGEATETNSTNNNGLVYANNDKYRYNWKTLKSWDSTCRQLILEFTNGETIVAYFKFD